MDGKSIPGAAIAAIAMASVFTLTVGSADAKLAKLVELRAKSTVKTSFAPKAGAGDYFGVVRFPTVRPQFGGQKVPKKMAARARAACYRMYAGGPKGKYTPYVRLVQRPKKYGGLMLNYAAETTFKPNGSWHTTGAGAYTTSELYYGNKIEAQGGLWDGYRNHRRAFQDVDFKYQRKTHTARCHAFTAVYDPR